MRLVNFELSKPSFAIELIGLGCTWDLHNSGTFVGAYLYAAENAMVMRWMVTNEPGAHYSGCDLVFKGLKSMIVSRRDPELPLSEDLCLASVSQIEPGFAEKPEHRVRNQWNVSDVFNLLFEFQSLRTIEVDAELAELVGFAKTPHEIVPV